MRRIVFAGRPEGVVRRFLEDIDLCSPEGLLRRDPATIDDLVLWGDFIDAVDADAGIGRLRRMRERTVISFGSADARRVARLQPWSRTEFRFVPPADVPRLLFGARAPRTLPDVPRSAWAPVTAGAASEAEELLLALLRTGTYRVKDWRAECRIPERSFSRHCKALLGLQPKRVAERLQAARVLAAWNEGASVSECAEFAQLSDEGSLRRFLARVGRSLPARKEPVGREARGERREARGERREARGEKK